MRASAGRAASPACRRRQSAPIIAHPDVRRMLLTDARADRRRRAPSATRPRSRSTAPSAAPTRRRAQAAHARASLLTPVAKAWSTDIGIEVASLGVQVHGGMGFIEETGAAQHFRDARIAPIYEGTNGIQAIDLVTRKLPLEGGASVEAYLDELRGIVEAVNATNDPALGWTACGSREAVDSLARATNWLLTQHRRGRRPGAGRRDALFAAVRHRRRRLPARRSRRSRRCGSTPTPPRASRWRGFSPRISPSTRRRSNAPSSKARPACIGADAALASLTNRPASSPYMSTLLISHPGLPATPDAAGHPERPERLRAVEHALEAEKFQALARVEAPLAALETIALCHPMDYVLQIRDASPNEGLVRIDADTSMSPGTFEAALRAAGGAVYAVDEVLTNKAANAFVATRPPGHHAETAQPMGFCFFNNAAIAARYAQKQHGLARTAIVDFDVHHGNGSQDIFWADKTVMYCSTHQMPLFPGTGAASERGEYDTIVNAPLAPGDGGEAFRAAFEERILPRLDEIRARAHRHLRRLRRPHARSARQSQPARRRFRLGDAQDHGRRRPPRRRPHRLGARRRLRSAGAGLFRRRPCHSR